MVVQLYRPCRWRDAQIEEVHDFANELTITLPGLNDEQKKKLADTAHEGALLHATRGNVEVELSIS